jgi:A/G-specific adenine glycosylase
MGKHIFTHIEWRMSALAAEASSPALPEGWVWADRAALAREYAVPNAFQPFQGAVEERLGHF